jgi:hypothetical protein
VVALVVGAACDLQVDRLIVPGRGRDQLFDDGFPAGKVERVGSLMPSSVACSRFRCSSIRKLRRE